MELTIFGIGKGEEYVGKTFIYAVRRLGKALRHFLRMICS